MLKKPNKWFITACIIMAILCVLFATSRDDDFDKSTSYSSKEVNKIEAVPLSTERLKIVDQTGPYMSTPGHTENSIKDDLSSSVETFDLIDDIVKEDIEKESDFVDGLMKRREFLTSSKKDKFQREMSQKNVREHIANIADYIKQMQTTQDKQAKARLLTAIAMEFYYAFLKTPPTAPQYWEYYKDYISALHEAVNIFESGTGAFYIAEECRHRKSLQKMHPVMPEFRLDDKAMNDELALIYYYKAFDLLAKSEPNRSNISDFTHPKWIVSSIMRGIENTLKDLNNEHEIERTREALREKHDDTKLGSQLAELFEAEEL